MTRKKVEISISITKDINLNKCNFIGKRGERYKDDFLDLCVSRKAFHHASLNQSHLTIMSFETFSTNTSMNMWRHCTVDYIFWSFQYLSKMGKIRHSYLVMLHIFICSIRSWYIVFPFFIMNEYFQKLIFVAKANSFGSRVSLCQIGFIGK